MNNSTKILFALAAGWLTSTVAAQDKIHYIGTELSNPTYHDGQLSPVVGVHNIQLVRANREHPDPSNGNGWTYNHQPMLAYWNGQFYMHYLSDPSDEHVPPSQTFLMTSGIFTERTAFATTNVTADIHFSTGLCEREVRRTTARISAWLFTR